MIRPEQVFRTLYPNTPWAIPADMPYLDGHFPGTPILPAIGILDASTYYLQRVLDLPELKIKSVSVAKFLSPIVPGQVVRIELVNKGENDWQVEWKENSASSLLATLRVQF